jgi:phosphatidylglycerophosphatase A
MRWRDYPILFVAGGLGTGFMRPWPGTWGSIPPVFLAWWLATSFPIWVFSTVAAGVVVVAVFSAHHALRFWGTADNHDPRRITIDEFAGMLVALLGLPTESWVYLAAFAAFRVIDVTKPPPCRGLEALPGGWGVVADDLAAGVYAGLITRLLLLMVG